MTSERKTLVKDKLTESRAYTLAVTESLTDEDWTRLAYSEGSEWQVIDLLRHVADSESGMTRLIVQVQAGGEGVPPDFDLARWNSRAVSKLQDKLSAELLEDMASNRQSLFAVIDTFSEEDWDKQGRHSTLKIMTIEEVCNLIADHERGHAENIESAIRV